MHATGVGKSRALLIQVAVESIAIGGADDMGCYEGEGSFLSACGQRHCGPREDLEVVSSAASSQELRRSVEHCRARVQEHLGPSA